ncbi:MAG: hypothetical protein KAU48_06230 [Candidatus Thorarchaeota archaeon]|nr:hypothetical protein [Candidatus Thorarchaeota archaeon]
MALSRRGLTLVSVFVIVDCILIWMVNTSTRATGAAPIALEDQFTVTLVLAGAAIIAVLVAIFFKFKPVPAC